MIVLFGVVSKTTDADLLGDGLLTGMTLLGDQLLLRCPGALLLLIGWTLDAGRRWTLLVRDFSVPVQHTLVNYCYYFSCPLSFIALGDFCTWSPGLLSRTYTDCCQQTFSFRTGLFF